MVDLETATTNFLARVDRHSPDEGKRVRAVLADLIRWSAGHAWGLSFSGRGAGDLIRYCVDGVLPPFWAIAPRSADGAKLTLLTAAHPRYPEELREEVRQLCARIDGRLADPDEVPEISCAKLLWPPHRDAVLELMSRALNRVHGRPEAAEPVANATH